MKSRELAAALLAKADEDIFVLQAFLTETRAADTVWGFHAQQAVEKTLKAWLSARQVNYPFTHQLANLFDLCQANGLAIEESQLELIDLTAYAADLRYGSVGPELDRLDRNHFLGLVEGIRLLVGKLL